MRTTYPHTSTPPPSGMPPDRERSRFASNVRSEQLAEDVLRTADLPHLGDENVCELLRRHILR